MKKIDELLPVIPEPPEGWDAYDRRVAAQRALERSAESRQARQRALARLVMMGIPLKEAKRIMRLDSIRDTDAIRVARGHLEGMIVLSGPIGSGKTTAAGWWIVQPYQSELATSSSRYLRAIQLERCQRFDVEEMQGIERARRLVIDDMGTEYLDRGGHLLSFVRGIVDARYGDQLPTMMTTNLLAKEFADRYGERMIDRLREVGAFVEINTPSMRRKP